MIERAGFELTVVAGLALGLVVGVGTTVVSWFRAARREETVKKLRRRVCALTAENVKLRDRLIREQKAS